VKSLGQGAKEGWLTKQGGSIKTWKRRWFVLKGDTLFYFKTPKDQDVTGSIALEPTSKAIMLPGKSTAKKHFFQVSVARRTYSIWSPEEKLTQEWVDMINEKVAEKNGGGGGGGASSSASSGPSPGTVDSDSDGDSDGEEDSGDGDAVSKPAEKEAAEPAKKIEAELSKGDASSTAAAVSGDTDAKKDDKPAAAAGDADASRTSSTPEGSVRKYAAVTAPRQRIAVAKGAVPFLQDEESKVLEFWQIWSESIPPAEEISGNAGIEFHVSTSANLEKLTWRTAGPQNIFIQKMVDFFWNVGAPESEIDRLNDVGALINPIKIGSWIDMSAKGGMDGGWYFPVEIPLKMAIEAADPGEPSKLVTEWAETYSVEKCFSVGRDMGAAPPRQTEIRVRLPGSSFDSQFDIAREAFKSFGFPPISDEAQAIFKAEGKPGLCLSIITSSEGFVRLGVMVPNPSTDTVLKLCDLVGAPNAPLAAFEGALGSSGPEYAEYQYLKEGFGYGVYKEGPDIILTFVGGVEEKDG
jgi:PH domain